MDPIVVTVALVDTAGEVKAEVADTLLGPDVHLGHVAPIVTHRVLLGLDHMVGIVVQPPLLLTLLVIVILKPRRSRVSRCRARRYRYL